MNNLEWLEKAIQETLENLKQLQQEVNNEIKNH